MLPRAALGAATFARASIRTQFRLSSIRPASSSSSSPKTKKPSSPTTAGFKPTPHRHPPPPPPPPPKSYKSSIRGAGAGAGAAKDQKKDQTLKTKDAEGVAAEAAEAPEATQAAEAPEATQAAEASPAKATTTTAENLPDLRQGIPSTLDLEFQSSNSSHQHEDEEKYNSKQYETSVDRRRAQMSNYLYASVLLATLYAGFYLSRPFGVLDHPDLPSGLEEEHATGWSPASMLARIRARMGSHVNYYTEPSFPKLLPDVPESQRSPYTLVLSLEDLMIHTTWDTTHGYRTAKRPGIDYFIRYLSQYYELVLFTSAPRQMADQIMAKLDPYHFIMWPLGREATKYEQGEYVKDLSYLNRPLNKTLIIDTHAPHVKNQPENAIILPKWNGEKTDPHVKDLVALIPFLEYVATMGIDDVRTVIKSFENTSIPEEFARREQLAREKFQAQFAEEQKRRPKFSLGSIATSLGVKGQGAGGGMVLADGQSVAEGLAQGKMLSDQIREQGQKQYEFLEKQIRENGEQWLREEKEEIRKATEAQAKEMKGGALAWFGGGSSKKE